jgi:DNA repair exonuclease SbcCD ATPase subunit
MNVVGARRTLIWGVLSLVVGAALFISFTQASGASARAQKDAEQRAENYVNTVLYKAISPGELDRPIEGRDYGALLIQVQAGILKDENVTRVRVWNRSGELVFSTDQRDRLGQKNAEFDALLNQVVGGASVSEVSGPTVAAQPGLAGSNEQLLRSFVTLRLGDQATAVAAAEIDQKYASVVAPANALWRAIKVGVAIVLLGCIVMLVGSLRGRRSTIPSGAVGDPRAAERLRSLERQMKDLEKRANDADDRAKDAEGRVAALSQAKSALEQQLANSERDLRDTLAARRTNEEDVAALSGRVPELERELAELRARAAASASAAGPSQELAAAEARAKEAEAERDRLAREIERMNIAMSESNGAHARAVELEARLVELQRAGGEAEGRLLEAQARATAAEQRLAEDEASAADADRRISEAEERANGSTAQVQGDLDRISIRLSETQTALAESTDRLTRLQGELERTRQEKADAAAELERARVATGERDHEFERLRATIAERDDQVQQLQQTVLERNAELEQLRSGLGERAGEVDHARAESAAMTAELEQLRAEAVAKNAELDALRADAGARAAELEQLGSLANGSAVFEPPDEATVGSRLSAFRKGRTAPRIAEPADRSDLSASVDAPPEPEPEGEPAAPEVSPEGLSLRERLTRAAAARHRVTTPTQRDET